MWITTYDWLIFYWLVYPKVTAVAFLKFFISHELESTKQSGDITLVNRINVADIFHLGSTFQVGLFVICTICTELHLRYSKSRQNQALVAQIYNAIHQAPVQFFFLRLMTPSLVPHDNKKEIKHGFLSPFIGKFPGATEHLKKQAGRKSQAGNKWHTSST